MTSVELRPLVTHGPECVRRGSDPVPVVKASRNGQQMPQPGRLLRQGVTEETSRRPKGDQSVLRSRSQQLASAALGAALVGSVLAGCSADDKPAPQASATPTEAPRLELATKVGEVSGRLPKPVRAPLIEEVGGLVRDWMESAYLSGPDPDLATAFDAFTEDAADQARHESQITSNAGLAGAESLTPRHGKMVLDVLAPRGKVAGMTARIQLVMDVPDTGAADQISGSLFLTKVKGDWEVFGFDLNRGQKVGGDQ